MPKTAKKKRKKAANKPNVQAPAQRQPADDKHPQLREVSPTELKDIVKAHEKWLESANKEGARAKLEWLSHPDAYLRQRQLGQANFRFSDFPRADFTDSLLEQAEFLNANLAQANFSNAKLERADFYLSNLQGADFYQADLRGAILKDAKLQKAKFWGANLQQAVLSGAALNKAKFTRADLREADLYGTQGLAEADLQDANLEGAVGLKGTEFARADITGAKLPEKIGNFEALEVVTETSKNARKIFLSMLLGCAYAWLTIATTTDPRLLTNSASSPLPIISTEIPIVFFYWTAPFILVALYVYLHFYLQLLWKGLAGLPARFQDGKPLDEHAYPWLLNGLVRRHFELLKDRPPMVHLQEWVIIFLAWWVVPLTLIGFWLRYLHRHEWVGTWIHVGLLVASVAAAIIFYRSTARTLRGTEPQSFQWKTSWQDRRTYQCVGVVLVGLVLSALSVGAINGVRTTNEYTSEFDNRFVFTDVWTWVPWAFERLGYSTFADLRETDVSTKPANWTGRKETIEVERAQVKRARLSGADLRYADATRAFLANADLRNARLQGADLSDAKLQGADLSNAKLQDADLRNARLQGATLFFASLQGADLSDAKLQDADLRSANLQDADLRSANLQGAVLDRASLQRANLGSANLQGADLGIANLQKANLRGANLQKAKLISAKLQDADLRSANLRGATLFFASLQGANLREVTGVPASEIKQARNWELAFYSDDFLAELDLPADHNETVKRELAKIEKEKKEPIIP